MELKLREEFKNIIKMEILKKLGNNDFKN